MPFIRLFGCFWRYHLLLRLRIRGRLIIFFLKFFGLNKEIKKSPRLFFTSLAMKIFVLIDQNLQD